MSHNKKPKQIISDVEVTAGDVLGSVTTAQLADTVVTATPVLLTEEVNNLILDPQPVRTGEVLTITFDVLTINDLPREIRISWGDGSVNLIEKPTGRYSAQHVYNTVGNFIIDVNFT